MNMAASSAPFSPPVISLIFKPKAACLVTARNSFSPLHAPKLTSPATQRRSCFLHLPEAVWPKPTKSWKLSATQGNFLLLEASPVQTSEEIVSTSDGGGINVVSALFFIAFICLSILTIGVIYIAVTDFCRRGRERSFEKEEAAKKKKSGKKGKVRARARAGPEALGRRLKKMMI
ncbi:hypothetical protein Sango_0459700 [Sesamum angolense]|uniref:Uncharacterized protein n=1 Tax=Sesamum angolense TaxID=2727404 RepID=A0AAE1XBD4_9LAMI|nr:hypothetical protein Sango_0459700 [Sesamum angolense]